MKLKMILILGAVLCAGGFVPKSAEAAGIHISIGDRPYYHGPHYYRGGARFVWVHGHWERRRHGRVWIRGHYVRAHHRDRYYHRGRGYGGPRIGIRTGWGY